MKIRNFGKKIIKAMVVALAMLLTVTGIIAFALSRKTVAGTDYSYLIETIDRDTKDDLDKRREERDKAQSDADAAHSKVETLNQEKDNLSGELEHLNGLSKQQREQYDLISAQYAAALDAKTEALNTYLDAQDELDRSEEQFKRRVSIMFEFQDKSYLEVLLESDSIAGFFTNMEMISFITESDAQAIQELETARDNAEAQADHALREAQDMEGIANEKLGQLEELESRIGVTEDALENIETDIAYWETKEDELEAYSQSLDGQISSLQSQYYAEINATSTTAAPTTTTTEATTTTESTTEATTASSETSANESSEATETTPEPTATPTPTDVPTATPVPTTPPTPSSNGSLSWPTWNHEVTSYYGNRVHPVYGTVKFHSGIDIGAWFGDTIMASASGTVIYVEKPVPGQDWGGSGYGNYCIIDHGNGVTTLYGHARDITVSTGDYVSAGQAIGVVGSTGTSTNAHLHYEVRVWGSTTDPLGYLQ